VELSAYSNQVELASDGGCTLIAAWFFLRGVYSRPVMLNIALTFASFIATRWHLMPPRVVVGGVGIDTQTAVFLGLVISMSWLLLGRAWRTWREQQGLSAEFEAAREMQESLVQRLPATPGFTVESAYRPASQVGGDFYRILHAGDDAILVVVGDVSGKGLKAAMTVSGLVCAMEAIRTRMPGAFLAELNNVAKAHLKSGFVTCCVALMKPNGEVRIANAGHLAPYADGRELEIEAGLPLGVAREVEYPETVTSGIRFTFLSDGVLEAANAAHELFGFDRSREVSIQPAAAIAQAAQTWGQNDDITVVTVRRTA
jgi:serine phosphatase RsbU (regulator of sigma subunit)